MVFNEEELKLLRAAMARIVPAGVHGGDFDLGAFEVGADQFVADVCAENPQLLASVRNALCSLSEQRFLELGASDQDECIRLQQSTDAMRSLIDLVQQGYLVSPLSWPALGFEVTA